MKKKIVIVGIAIITLLLAIVSPLSLLISVAICAVFFIVNNRVKSSQWWKEQIRNVDDFMPMPFFRYDHRRNFDMINLGTLPASYDFSYSSVRGLNLSSGFQSLNMDLKILKFYHSYLRAGGFVALTISPIIDKHIEDFRYMSRFYRYIPKEKQALYGDYYRPCVELLDSDCYKDKRLIRFCRIFPALFYIDGLVNRCVLSVCKLLGGGKNCTSIQLREYLPEDDADILERLISFCKDRGYRPFILIPPIQRRYYNKGKIDSFAEKIKSEWVDKLPVLDYSSSMIEDERFGLPNCLKKEEAEKFTVVVLKDITTAYDNFKIK